MARYTCLFTVAVAPNRLQQLLAELLQSCNCETIYHTADYLMAREIPGRVSFTQLVTVEVLIDKTTASDAGVRMSIVVKNEELPLQVKNHCRQMFENVNQAIIDSQQWRLIEQVAG